ncbi:hypothetical protein ACFV3R_09670 [Streptomyces sp. NPDC059740]|uniref:hypothetical protein n=1 Tax=Streptomyces sp. NPDC059740 TaxID=3346926 RepID=UPI003649D53E
MFALFRRSAKAVAPSPAKTAEQVVLCPETGLPYGEPGSNERLAWIFAMNDLEDARERALSSGFTA